MGKIFRSFAIAWVLLLTTALIARAGGWAVITIDELPAPITAGQAFSIGFTVRQHGLTLRSDLEPIVRFDRAGARESFQVTAQRQGAEGHYLAQIKFPSAGQWNWRVDIEQFGMITQPMPTLTVQSAQAGPAPAGTQLSPLSKILEFITALRRAVAGQVSATTLPVGQTAGKSAPVDQVALGNALFSAKGCVMCHTHAAIKTQAGPYSYGDTQPPDLSQKKYGADYLRLWLTDPAAVKPGTAMPQLGLKPAEIEALIAFLNNAQVVSSAQPQAGAVQECPLTAPVRDEPPRDPNADPFGLNYWYINADRTLWAGPVAGNYPWQAGGNKVIWIRPQGTQLTISGRRLDSDAPPLETWIPDGYRTGFQVTGMTFPTGGCWEITARSGGHDLRFVTTVGPGD
jgi:cytochrome c2